MSKEVWRIEAVGSARGKVAIWDLQQEPGESRIEFRPDWTIGEFLPWIGAAFAFGIALTSVIERGMEIASKVSAGELVLDLTQVFFLTFFFLLLPEFLLIPFSARLFSLSSSETGLKAQLRVAFTRFKTVEIPHSALAEMSSYFEYHSGLPVFIILCLGDKKFKIPSDSESARAALEDALKKLNDGYQSGPCNRSVV
jgi:hypothetical protein